MLTLFLLLAPMAVLGKTMLTGCNPLRDKKGEYLDRHAMMCEAGYALTGFQLTMPGECGGDRGRYVYNCEPVWASAEGPHDTGCSEIKHQYVQNLDRHNNECPKNKIMKGTKLFWDGCGGNDGHFRQTCMNVDSTSLVENKDTGCNDLWGRSVHYLDRHKVECPSGKFLTRYRLSRAGCDSSTDHGRNNMKIEYTCMAISTPNLAPTDAQCYLDYCEVHEDLKNAFCGGGACTTKQQYLSCQTHWNDHGKAEFGRGDRSCDPENLPCLCGVTPDPTPSPTASPTDNPTDSPTPSPPSSVTPVSTPAPVDPATPAPVGGGGAGGSGGAAECKGKTNLAPGVFFRVNKVKLEEKVKLVDENADPICECYDLCEEQGADAFMYYTKGKKKPKAMCKCYKGIEAAAAAGKLKIQLGKRTRGKNAGWITEAAKNLMGSRDAANDTKKRQKDRRRRRRRRRRN